MTCTPSGDRLLWTGKCRSARRRAVGLSREVRARHRPVALHARRLRQAVYDGPSPSRFIETSLEIELLR